VLVSVQLQALYIAGWHLYISIRISLDWTLTSYRLFSLILLLVVMKRVRFSRTKTVYVADNYDRTSPWEIVVRDRVQFKRRIEMTEKLLSSILTESHRDLIRLKRLCK